VFSLRAAVEGSICSQCGHVCVAGGEHPAPTIVDVPVRKPVMDDLFPLPVLPTSEPPEPPSLGPVTIPAEMQRSFNVGAFFLGFIWACGNASVKQRWIGGAFLVLGVFTSFTLSLPYNVWLGFNGNRIAAASNPWPSIAMFRETQRNWALASLGWIVAFPIFVILLEVIGFSVVWAALTATGHVDALASPSPAAH
jgi:hypothetical protein